MKSIIVLLVMLATAAGYAGTSLSKILDKFPDRSERPAVTAAPPVVVTPPAADPEPKDDDNSSDAAERPNGPETAPVYSTSGATQSQPGGKHVYNYNPASSRGTIKTVLRPGVRPWWVVAWADNGWKEKLYRATPNEHGGMWRFYGKTKVGSLPAKFYVRIGGLPGGDVYYVVTDPTKRLSSADPDVIRPFFAGGDRGVRAGLTVDLFAASRLRRPTKSVYVEEAVALWSPGYGELVAAAGAGVADVNAAVDARDEVVPQTWQEAVAGHVKRNAGRYIGGAALIATGAGGYAIYEANKDDGKPAASAPTTDSHDNKPANSQAVQVTAGDYSPVAININVTAMPPE